MALLAVLLACPVAAIAVEGDTDTQPGTVQGFTPGGTTINLFDYWITGQDAADNVNWVDEHANRGINKGHTLNFGKGMEGGERGANEWTQSAEPRIGLVANKLNEDGYPVLEVGNKESLAYLFNPESFEGKQAYSNVGNLLQVDNTGYFYYDCKANFAEFDAEDNAFTLYDGGAVNAYGSSPDGQFFPFNTYNQVAGENIDSVNEVIKHYFGMTMRTRFVQQNGGHTTPDEDQAVTYNFSGDDDIWIFIDGVLVGDLGGIHDATSIEIDFSTGMVRVYDDGAKNDDAYKDTSLNNEWDEGEKVYNGGGQGETLRSIFEDVYGVGNVPKGLFNEGGDTFADNTYHTLDFFYLERGNTDSNMALKYNLINIPETDIVKVDQDGNPVAGAEFKLYDRAAYAQNSGVTPLASAVTEGDGSVVLLDPDNTNRPITLESLWEHVVEEGSGATTCDLMLVETDVPAGHRVAQKIPLQILKKEKTEGDPFYLLLSKDPWTTGAYAMPKVMLTAPEETSIQVEPLSDNSTISQNVLQKGDIQDGLLFAIVEKKVGDGWLPVYGDPLNGWAVAETLDASTVIAAAKATHAQFALDTTGSFRAEVNSLPGDILKYSFFTGEKDAEYRGAYFYSTAKTFDGIEKENTATVTNPEAFTRNFSARVCVSNIINRFAVQKLDEKGSPVEDATMALYTNDQVTVDKNGVATLNDESAEPLQTATTATLTKENAAIDLEGACIFTNLNPGVYWVGEQVSPKEPSDADPNGYLKNNTLAKVLVTDDGVFADAGKAGDGVTVMRGVGRVMRSMVQFAVADDIDVTLHNIVAQARMGTVVTNEAGDTSIEWGAPDPESELHLQYAGDGDRVLDYTTDASVSDEELQSASEYYTVDEGVPGLVVNQCAKHKVESEAAWTPLVEDDKTPIDITPLFTGVNVVRIANQRVSGLDVTKKVTADDPTAVGSNDEFTFTVRFTNPVGADGLATPLTQEQAEAVDMGVVAFETAPTGSMATRPVKLESDGSVKVTIKANETARFVNVPVGTTYTVIEEPCDGYVLSDKSEDMTGTIAFSDQRAVATAVVKNIKVDGATAAIDVQKTVTGTETTDNFTFTIALSRETDEGIRDGVSVMRDGRLQSIGTDDVTISPVTVTADFAEGHQTQRASSEQLVFTEERTYIFDVKETVTDKKPNWTYDSASTRKVTVVVERESDTDTQLTAEVIYNNSNAPQENDKRVGDAAAFTNVYTAPTTTAQIKAVKRLTGDSATLLADQFAFELRDKDGKLVADAKNDAAGNVTFDANTYDADGIYTYTLREVLPDDDDDVTPGIQQDGFTYDETIYRVSVSVNVNEQGGLTAVVTYNEGADGTGKAVDTPVFENAYTKWGGGDPVIPDDPNPDTPDPDEPDPDTPDPDTPDPDTPDPETPDTPDPDTPGTPDGPDPNTPIDKIPGTGDAMPAMVAGVAALGAVCIAGAVVLKKRSE
ncbi:MAG TPA: hypothetical protein IAC01_02010 [Candidatus Limicola stercorigallinarum]|nr:hypothetical protein [Candidatus Limicola stercorigallinarum]